MPIYEYKCEKCEHKLEALQKMSDDSLKKCPNCGKKKLKKLISSSSHRIWGGGVHKQTSKFD